MIPTTENGDVRLVQAVDPKEEPRAYGIGPVTLRVPKDASEAEIAAALSEYLPACEAAAVAAQPLQVAPSPPTGTVPTGSSSPLVMGLLSVLAVWWACGPVLVQTLAWGTWPVRLAWRHLERAVWLWAVKHDLASWDLSGERPGRAQRWALDAEGLRDRRTPRQQDRAAGRSWEGAGAYLARRLRESKPESTETRELENAS